MNFIKDCAFEENVQSVKELVEKIYFGQEKELEFQSLNEMVSIFRTIKTRNVPEVISDNFLNSFAVALLREDLINEFGFPLITKEFMDNLYKYINKGKKCLEVMSGKGIIAKELKDRGLDIIATDNYSWNNKLNIKNSWIDVENIDCLEAIKKYGEDIDFVIVSWIPYGDTIGYELIKLMDEINPKCKMIVIGEGVHGCTANELFFKHCESIHGTDVGYEDDIPGLKRWSGINDHVNVVKYKV